MENNEKESAIEQLKKLDPDISKEVNKLNNIWKDGFMRGFILGWIICGLLMWLWLK